MAQRINGIYKLVTIPAIYNGIQRLLGGDSSVRRFISECVKPEEGMSVLDVGCGPARLFPYLQGVHYTGIDLNAPHIDKAKELYGDKGRFLVGDVADGLTFEKSSFDLIVVGGLLHHLTDDVSTKLLKSLLPLLKPKGRIVTFDNVRLPRANLIATALINLDSGLHVRTPEGYRELAEGLTADVDEVIYRDLLRVPYDHFCMIIRPRGIGKAKGDKS